MRSTVGLSSFVVATLLSLSVHAQVRQLAINDGQISGDLYLPPQVPAPAIFVLHTACGKVGIADRAVARMLAEAGFVAFAIEYPNEGKPTWVKPYLDWMAARPEAAGHQFGAVGFSAGGLRSFWLGVSPRVKAIVSFYGTYDLSTSPIAKMRATPAGSPILRVDKISAAVLMLHGQLDTEVPLEQIERMKQAVLARGLPAEAVIYPGDYHGFDRGVECSPSDTTANGTRIKHDPAAEKDSYARTVAWFKTYLK